MPCRLELYTGPHCELCDTAKAMIYATLPDGHYELTMIDVTKSSLETKKTYGLRIPVLGSLESDKKLAWPFTPEQLMSFTNQCYENNASP